MKMIVGLGNPGKKYALTRHNVGFEVIDLINHEIGAEKPKSIDFALVTEGQLDTEEIILVKPQTFMNSSGLAVSLLSSRYNISLEDLWVIYDDIDLELSMIRIRRSGSPGGHKGMKSITNSLKSQLFPRIRVGIGQPPQGMDPIDYVLSKFNNQERDEIIRSEQLVLEALKVMLREGIETAMNKFNSRKQ
ncbi:aminoacyl-tRNA hydrolase [Candidatus Poribacteria bacterium]|nr:aminoacyl-tRNA hydrolase [Candidatus Poribacteria bacterium]